LIGDIKADEYPSKYNNVVQFSSIVHKYIDSTHSLPNHRITLITAFPACYSLQFDYQKYTFTSKIRNRIINILQIVLCWWIPSRREWTPFKPRNTYS